MNWADVKKHTLDIKGKIDVFDKKPIHGLNCLCGPKGSHTGLICCGKDCMTIICPFCCSYFIRTQRKLDRWFNNYYFCSSCSDWAKEIVEVYKIT